MLPSQVLEALDREDYVEDFHLYHVEWQRYVDDDYMIVYPYED